jgi:rubrerythrin
MEGGLKAWEGILPQGTPEPLIAFFTPAGSPVEYIALGWLLEDGMGKFYGEIAKKFDEAGLTGLFGQLAQIEEHHKAELVKLYGSISGGKARDDFPRGIIADYPEDRFIEGGILLKEALGWVEGKQAKDVFELCITLETVSYDRYLVMATKVEDALSKDVLKVLSQEERKHLRSMTEQFEKI